MEYEGATIEEAKKAAADDLGIDLEELEVEEVKEEKGFLGIVKKKVKVKIKSIKENKEIKESKEWMSKAKSFLESVMPSLTDDFKIGFIEQEENNIVTISGEDMGLAIGRHGRTIEALQLLLNIVVNRDVEEKKRVILDIENYRQKRKESLERMAEENAHQFLLNQ